MYKQNFRKQLKLKPSWSCFHHYWFFLVWFFYMKVTLILCFVFVPFCWWNFDISKVLIFIFLLLGRSPTLNFIPRNSVQSLLKTCMINSRNLKRTTSTSSQVRSPFSSWLFLPFIRINLFKYFLIWKRFERKLISYFFLNSLCLYNT